MYSSESRSESGTPPGAIPESPSPPDPQPRTVNGTGQSAVVAVSSASAAGATGATFRFGKIRISNDTRRPCLPTENFCSAFNARVLLIFAVRSMK